MTKRRTVTFAIARSLLRSPDRFAHGLVLKDLDTWIRLQFLGVVAHSGVAEKLDTPRSVDTLADLAGVVDRELLEALLDLGVALGEVRVRNGRYRARGRRLRALANDSGDLRGLLEELVVFGNPIYTALDSHLRGAPTQPYDAEWGAVIAESSRIVEPVFGPVVDAVARAERPGRVLDIGCGSGGYLRRMLAAAPGSLGLGIDPEGAAIGLAADLLHDSVDANRWELRHARFEEAAADLGRFGLATLMNNIYYWPPADRSAMLGAIRRLLDPRGVVVVASATANRQPVNRHFDVMLRATSGAHRLPTRRELESDLVAAGFAEVETIEPLPSSGLVIATGRNVQGSPIA